MSKQHYDKLVRDRIPEIIAASGAKAEFVQLDAVAFVTALKAKLLEEAHEVANASEATLGKELADLQEVMDALMQCSGLSRSQVEATQHNRRVERGGFDARLKLLWVE